MILIDIGLKYYMLVQQPSRDMRHILEKILKKENEIEEINKRIIDNDNLEQKVKQVLPLLVVTSKASYCKQKRFLLFISINSDGRHRTLIIFTFFINNFDNVVLILQT